METDDAWYGFGSRRVVGNIVRSHPIFIAPDVTQQDQHETGQVEDEFFDWNGPAHGRYLATQDCCLVSENKKGVAKEHIQQEPDWREHSDGSPKCFSRKPQIGPAGKPPPERRDRHNEQEQAPCISKRRRIIRCGLQNCWVNDGAQCNRSWNNEHRCDGKNDIERSSVLHAAESLNRTVLSFKI